MTPPTCLCGCDDVSPVDCVSAAECDLQKALGLEERAKDVSEDVGVEPGSLQVLPAYALLPVVMDLVQGDQYYTWAI